MEGGDGDVEVETAMRRYLIAQAGVNGYVVGKVYRHRLEVPVEKTGGAAIVLRRNGGWAQRDPVKTSEFPIVQVRVIADPTRDDDGNVAKGDALDRAWAVQRAITPTLHGLRDVWMGAVGSNRGLRVITCQAWGEPMELMDRDMTGTAHHLLYGDPLGDTAMVIAQYALQVVH